MPSPRPALLLCLGLMLGPAPTRAACDKTLSVAVSDYPPYVYQDVHGQWSGLDIDLLRAVFAAAGCSYRFAQQVAPRRVLDIINRGQTDVMLAATETEPRRALNRFGPPYRMESVALVGLAGQIDQYRDVDSLDNLLQRHVRLLVPSAGWYGADYERAQPALRAAGLAVEFTYLGQGIRMLVAGRAPLMMADPTAIQTAARVEGVAVEVLPYVLLSAPVHMMFSKASVSEHDVQQLSAATQQLEQQGVLRALRSAHGIR